ncbi:hypothetical protein BDY21DRAFT_365428 [Lineolata rhizophorae]|uniref:Copper acquisition factor BIM1-like domain-containing protein n=1 Tax=Lineolata rhizophorae TaxID=578093 RepID=A0A6A6NWR7_9PEZI|nr:hypothetical protein BDY21DRAFT_365428 [Lineolata rhizophorae]
MLSHQVFASLLLSVQASLAHFLVEYPYWRGDSFEDPASQWLWPCANVNQTESADNRTSWPLTGGSVVLEVHHQWAYTFINLGLGNEVTSFNVTLVEGFNQTGNGTLCMPEIGGGMLAELAGTNITEGTNATLQFVQVNERGNALYNCADITFTESAEILSGDACMNSTGVGGVELVTADEADVDEDSEGSSPTESGAAEPTSTDNAAALASAPAIAVGAAALMLGALIGGL